MSEILRGVLKMPPSCWSDDEFSVAQRHAIYCEAADKIDELEAVARGAEEVLSGGWSMEYGFNADSQEYGYWIMPRSPDAQFTWGSPDRRSALRAIGDASFKTKG